MVSVCEDMGVAEKYAHLLADDRKWKEVETLKPIGIATIVFGENLVPIAGAVAHCRIGKC